MRFFLVIAFMYLTNATIGFGYEMPSFVKQEIDPGQAPWGKQLADLDGDGFVDIVEAGGYVNIQKIYWYRYPDWTRFQIGTVGGDDDLQVGDINRDGALDVVVNGGIYWYENPRGSGGDVTAIWTRHTVDSGLNTHDLLLSDVDQDGKLDIVTRGAGDSGPTYILFQNTPDDWTRVQMTNVPIGEGSAIGDIDRDGKPDLIGNGYWLKQPANPRADVWPKYDFAAWASIAGVGVADINKDGRLDIVLSPSETAAGMLAWFEGPADPTSVPWPRHDIMMADDLHRFHLVDVNLDGERDIVFGEMHQSDTKRLGVLYNNGLGTSWTLSTFSTGGAHNIAVGDVGADGDLDILTANWNVSAPDGGAINLWINQLDPDITPPNVSITAPANDAVVSGTVTVVADAADNVGVAGVWFRVDGVNRADELTSAPYQIFWDTTTTSTGVHRMVAVARDLAGNITTSSLITVTVVRALVPDTTPPEVSITAPANDAVVSGTVTVVADASDNVGVAGVWFRVDGVNRADELTSAPYRVDWDTTTFSTGVHRMVAVARDLAGNITTSSLITVTVVRALVPDTTPPEVSITAPANDAVVSGTVTVVADASDNVGVTGVQFRLDAAALGIEDDNAPYSVTWNTTNATMGTHTLKAVARDAAGNVTTSTLVSVNVARHKMTATRHWRDYGRVGAGLHQFK